MPCCIVLLITYIRNLVLQSLHKISWVRGREVEGSMNLELKVQCYLHCILHHNLSLLGKALPVEFLSVVRLLGRFKNFARGVTMLSALDWNVCYISLSWGPYNGCLQMVLLKPLAL